MYFVQNSKHFARFSKTHIDTRSISPRRANVHPTIAICLPNDARAREKAFSEIFKILTRLMTRTWKSSRHNKSFCPVSWTKETKKVSRLLVKVRRSTDISFWKAKGDHLLTIQTPLSHILNRHSLPYIKHSKMCRPHSGTYLPSGTITLLFWL